MNTDNRDPSIETNGRTDDPQTAQRHDVVARRILDSAAQPSGK